MAGDMIALAEPPAEADTEDADPAAHLEWMMPAGWLAVAAGLCLAACVAAGALS